MTTTRATSAKHTREIVRDDSSGEPEFAVYCSCKTHHATRLSTYSAAVTADNAHKAAVADGSWQAEQDAEAARRETLAPLHAAIAEREEAMSARQSAGFAAIIAKQNGGDVGEAMDALHAAKARLARAEIVLAALRA